MTQRLRVAAGCLALVLYVVLPTLAAELDEQIKPLPPDVRLDQRKLDLGRKLFVDPISLKTTPSPARPVTISRTAAPIRVYAQWEWVVP